MALRLVVELGFFLAIVGAIVMAFAFLARRLAALNRDMAQNEQDFAETMAQAYRPPAESKTVRSSPPSPAPMLAPPEPPAPGESPGAPVGPAAAPARIGGASAVDDVRRKLEIAGQIQGSEENIAIPGLEKPAQLLRLKDRKTMLVLPEEADIVLARRQLSRANFVCLAHPTDPMVLSKLGDFTAERLFR